MVMGRCANYIPDLLDKPLLGAQYFDSLGETVNNCNEPCNQGTTVTGSLLFQAGSGIFHMETT